MARQPAAARRRARGGGFRRTGARSARQRHERPRILVVDDESSIRDLLAKTLALAEYDVDTAPDGRSALERLRLYPYDLLIADLKMPGIDGLTVIREAKRLKADFRSSSSPATPPRRRHRSGQPRRVRLSDEAVPRPAGARRGREGHRGTRITNPESLIPT